MSEWIDVAAVDEVPNGDFRVVEVDGAMVAVFNLDGTYFAVDDICTHDGGSLGGGCVEGDEIVCPRHGARFRITTGEVTAPPACEALHRFPVRIREQRIEVRDDRWD